MWTSIPVNLIADMHKGVVRATSQVPADSVIFASFKAANLADVVKTATGDFHAAYVETWHGRRLRQHGLVIGQQPWDLHPQLEADIDSKVFVYVPDTAWAKHAAALKERAKKPVVASGTTPVASAGDAPAQVKPTPTKKKRT